MRTILPILRKSLLGAAVLILAACSTVTVTTSSDPSAPFAKYHTYTLAPASHGLSLSPMSEAALRAALRTRLAARGIEEVSGPNADLDVVRHIIVADKVSVSQYTNWGYGYRGAWPYRYGAYGMWAGAPQTFVDVNSYTEGTLVLDFVDARTKKLVFRGVGKGTVGSPSANAQAIQEAVDQIAAAFPRC